MAETEQDLPFLLNALNSWTASNDMVINVKKSNVIHFRTPSKQKTNFLFKCGNDTLEMVDRYVYLGLLLTEHLDFEKTVKYVAQSASRALGLLISKCKLAGGLPYNVYTKLFESIVSPVINYGACIWGFKTYSCINAVQNRAMRFFLGVGRYTPVAALHGEMGWEPCIVKQLVCIGRFVVRTSCTYTSRINKRIALWADSRSSSKCKNWFYIVRKRFLDLQLINNLSLPQAMDKSNIQTLKIAITNEFKISWYESVHSPIWPTGRGNNKLRTYALFKTDFEAEKYCQKLLPHRHRAAFAKFRCGAAPLRIETGRFENKPLEERKCPFCDIVETESHVLLDCDTYSDLRQDIFSRATKIDRAFDTFPAVDKIRFLFSNHNMISTIAKTCFNILQRSAFYLTKS